MHSARGTRTVRGPSPRRSAQALVEFALVMPVLLIMTLGTIDLGRGMIFGVAVQQGAREGARLGMSGALDTTLTDSTVLQRMVDASAPALTGCTWSGSANMSTSTTSTGTTASMLSGQSCGGGKWTLTVSYPNGKASGNKIEVKAVGQVALYTGFLTGAFNLSLTQITVQGDAVMAYL